MKTTNQELTKCFLWISANSSTASLCFISSCHCVNSDPSLSPASRLASRLSSSSSAFCTCAPSLKMAVAFNLTGRLSLNYEQTPSQTHSNAWHCYSSLWLYQQSVAHHGWRKRSGLDGAVLKSVSAEEYSRWQASLHSGMGAHLASLSAMICSIAACKRVWRVSAHTWPVQTLPWSSLTCLL